MFGAFDLRAYTILVWRLAEHGVEDANEMMGRDARSLCDRRHRRPWFLVGP